MKNWMRIFLVLMLLVSLCACGGEPATEAPQDGNHAADVGTAHTQPQEEEETQQETTAGAEEPVIRDNLLEIRTAADLVAFREIVNSTEKCTLDAILLADLDLSGICGPGIGDWEPIGTYFGVFDGNGHTISGLYIMEPDVSMAGLFDTLGDVSVVKNLNMENVQINATVYGGAIASRCNGMIDNCTVSGELTGTNLHGGREGCPGIGGIVGDAGKDAVISNCTNAANLTAVRTEGEPEGYAGGIACYSTGIVTNCVNTGSIHFGTAEGAGGITGSAEYGEVNDCTNSGSVSAYTYAGGISGYAKQMHMNRCGNTGSVEAAQYAGGVVGACSTKVGNLIMNSFNKGQVSNTPWRDKSEYMEMKVAAGVVGRINGTVLNCYNTGTIISQTDADTFYVLGLVGRFNSNAGNVRNCYNMGELQYIPEKGEYRVYGVGRVETRTTENVFCLDNCQLAHYMAEGDRRETEAFRTAEEFRDGTVLALLQSYEPDEDREISGWVQGEHGPCFDWE